MCLQTQVPAFRITLYSKVVVASLWIWSLFLQVAISTDDVYKSAEVVNHVIQELGGKITRQAGPIPGINTKITSFLDPDGWKTVSRLLRDFYDYVNLTSSGSFLNWCYLYFCRCWLTMQIFSRNLRDQSRRQNIAGDAVP